jgi:hypothetical protein
MFSVIFAQIPSTPKVFISPVISSTIGTFDLNKAYSIVIKKVSSTISVLFLVLLLSEYIPN